MTKIANMDGSRKIAILLLSLDQASAADILGRLPREQVERVTFAIANADHVTREEQESILNEFKEAFASRPLMHATGPEAARELLERTLDQNDVQTIQQRVDEQVLAGPFAFLQDRHPDDIRMLIRGEHPQTIAFIAAQLPSPLAAEMLAGFEPGTQAEILERLANIGPTDVGVLAEIASLLRNRIGRAPVRTRGVVRAADVLRETPQSLSHSVLKSLDQKDAGLADSLRDSLFSFKDLVLLDDETLRIVLQETDKCPWAIALKGCPETLRRRILSILSPAIAQALKGEMDSLGPLRLSEITNIQRQIAGAVFTLESECRIELPRKESTKMKNAQSNPNTEVPMSKVDAKFRRA